MLQIIPTILGLFLAYLATGISVSFAIFPKREKLPILGRIALSVSLSSSIVTSSMLLSNWLLGGFETYFILGLQMILIAVSWFAYWFQRTHRSELSVSAGKTEDSGKGFPKPALWLFSSATVLMMFFRFYNGLLFPITNWDSLTEFAYLGRLYFMEGRIPLISGATLGIGSSANYPPFVSLLYAWFYLTSGGINEVLARAVSPIFSLLTVIITYSLAREMYESRALAMSSIFFLVTIPIFVFVSEECLSDIIVTSTSLSSIYFLYLGLRKEVCESNRFILVSGLLAGISAFIKYTGLVFLIIGFLIIVIDKIELSKHFSLRERVGRAINLRILGIFFIGFLVFGTPWYVRNLIVLGNPVYPLLYQIFGGKGIDVWMMKNSWDAHFSIVQAQNSLDLSIKSLILTYYTVFFRISPYETLDLGPFLGAFFALGIMFSIKKREQSDKFLLALTVSYLFMWRFGFGTFLRYLSMILPALAIISARGLTSVYEMVDSISIKRIMHSNFSKIPNRVWLKIIVFMVLFQGLLLPSIINGVRGYKTWGFSSPFETQDQYLSIRFQGTWDAIKYLNETPLNATILTYDHSLAYYVDRKFIYSDEPRMKDLHLAQSSLEVYNLLSSLNISYIAMTTVNEKYFPLLRSSFFYTHLSNGSYAELVLNKFPSEVYVVKHRL